MVEPTGFEPVTSSMPSRRAPNCATAPLSAWFGDFIAFGMRKHQRFAFWGLGMCSLENFENSQVRPAPPSLLVCGKAAHLGTCGAGGSLRY